MRKYVGAVSLALTLLVTEAGNLFAHTTSGFISWLATDEQQWVVANAAIVARNVGTLEQAKQRPLEEQARQRDHPEEDWEVGCVNKRPTLEWKT